MTEIEELNEQLAYYENLLLQLREAESSGDSWVWDIPLIGGITEDLFTNRDELEDQIEAVELSIITLKQRLARLVNEEAANNSTGYEAYLPAILLIAIGVLIVKKWL